MFETEVISVVVFGAVEFIQPCPEACALIKGVIGSLISSSTNWLRTSVDGSNPFHVSDS